MNDSLISDTLSTAVTAPEISLWGPIVKIILILILLAVMLYGLVYVLKRYLYRTGPVKNHNLIHLKETFYLAPKSKIHLLQVGKKYLLIGENEHSIHSLADLSQEDFNE
ncbi:MAG: flagellar biosynthetic protein FliO [Candidatus Delongbacteria bacterium]|nr:flagellar biosynthetic protein FliO [Candidatus Delongbacteria bacterium]